MGALSYVRMVLWGFFGIRRRGSANDELAKVQAPVLVGVALVLAALFGLALWGFARLAAHSLGG